MTINISAALSHLSTGTVYNVQSSGRSDVKYTLSNPAVDIQFRSESIFLIIQFWFWAVFTWDPRWTHPRVKLITGWEILLFTWCPRSACELPSITSNLTFLSVLFCCYASEQPDAAVCGRKKAVVLPHRNHLYQIYFSHTFVGTDRFASEETSFKALGFCIMFDLYSCDIIMDHVMAPFFTKYAINAKRV